MVLDGSRETPEMERLLKDLVARQTSIEKDVERLETLEGAKKRTGLGCIEFIDYDLGSKAVYRVDRNGACDGNNCWTHLTIWWAFSENANLDLWMQVNLRGTATYNYAYTYTQGGATIQAGVDGATAFYIGNIKSGELSTGRIDFPFYPWMGDLYPFGEWVAYDPSEDANSRMIRGNWGGIERTDANSPFIFQFFATGAPVLNNGHVYLYGWCPEMTVGGAPPD